MPSANNDTFTVAEHPKHEGEKRGMLRIKKRVIP
jgi:hypothetical protein